MQRHFFSLRIAGWVVLAAIAVATADLLWHGFAVLHDPDGVVASAAIAGIDGDRPMREFAPRYRAARPRAEGMIRATCRNGRVIERGRVAPGRRTSVTIVRKDCALPLARDDAGMLGAGRERTSM